MPDFFKIARFFLMAIGVTVAIVTTSTLFPFIVGKYVWFRTAVDLAFFFTVMGLLWGKQAEFFWTRLKSLFRSPIAIAVTVFTIAFLLASFFGIDPKWSFWSNFERGEGGFQILHLWFFFILTSLLFHEEKQWHTALRWFFVGATLMILYGVLANFGMFGFIGDKFSTPGFRFAGSIGNSSYVAVFLAFMVYYVLYFFAEKYKDFKQKPSAWILLGLLAIFLAFFFLAGTRGAFMGLVASAVFAALLFAYSHKVWRKWLITGVVAFIAVVVLLINFKNTPFVQAIPGHRVFDVSISAETFATRRIMWNVAWEGFKVHPVFGWGPENYIKIFDTHFDTRYFIPKDGFGAWFDRAHSLIFDYLAETGIVGLLSFVGMFIVFYWRFFIASKKQDSFISQKSSFQRALIAAIPIAYLVQGLVLFDVLPTYLNLFFFLAFSTFLLEFKSSSSNTIIEHARDSNR
ncbi:MAG: O-antigen ligase family protein [Patescibacteria group bacterium]